MNFDIFIYIHYTIYVIHTYISLHRGCLPIHDLLYKFQASFKFMEPVIWKGRSTFLRCQELDRNQVMWVLNLTSPPNGWLNISWKTLLKWDDLEGKTTPIFGNPHVDDLIAVDVAPSYCRYMELVFFTVGP